VRLQDVTVIGTTPEYELVHDAFVERGRFLTPTDVDRGAAVALVGTDVVDAAFANVDPVGKDLLINGRPFRIVGVLERKGRFLFRSRDNLVVIPLGVQKRDQRYGHLEADIKAVSSAYVPDVVDQATDLLRRERRLRYWSAPNFALFTQDALTDLYGRITGGIYLVMIAISCIGLVVGGVGVMNIMLVSVTERTREIGVRKALGARRRDILWQFLTEAMTLTGLGGVLGIAVGALVSALVDRFSPFPAVLQPAWIVLALLTSVGVGLVFGLWPAARAARLDPIDALRYE
jgi:putative ABC transport system permease protein